LHLDVGFSTCALDRFDELRRSIRCVAVDLHAFGR
jgi:hypothetical protein